MQQYWRQQGRDFGVCDVSLGRRKRYLKKKKEKLEEEQKIVKRENEKGMAGCWEFEEERENLLWSK